jgi:4'-phosphopantetheinyl transferase EntD
VIATAAASRRREFATGRLCAREALATLGLPWGPIGRNEGRAPRWPPGIVGSITHCAGYCAAAAARSSELVTIGIDAEPDLSLPEEVRDRIAQPDEWAHLAALARTEPAGPAWDRLLFCAKEAVYKAWFPLMAQWLGFDQVTVHIKPESEAFDVRLLVPGPTVNGQQISTFTGRWLALDGLIVCAVAVAVAPS